MSKKAMKLALEAYMAAGFGNSTDFALQQKAHKLAVEALAEQPAPVQQEPVATTCRDSFLAGYEAAQADAKVCDFPPHGWHCTRNAGHDGPCAAVETDDHELVANAMKRLAEQPAPVQQEPVAWMNPHGGFLSATYIENFASGLDKEIHNIPLYKSTQPAQRKPLTDEQREEIAKGWRGRNWTVGDIIDATEAAHGIKENT